MADGYCFIACHAVILYVGLFVCSGCSENEACDPVPLYRSSSCIIHTGTGSLAVPDTAYFCCYLLIYLLNNFTKFCTQS